MTREKFFEHDAKSELPLIGWVCTYTPEEIIYAAGFHPFRLVENNPSTRLADTYLHHNLCPYVRSCLDLGLRMEGQKLKGIVIVNSCDALRSLYHVGRHCFPSSFFVHFMNLPRITSPLAVDYFKQEIQKLIIALEGFIGRKIEESNVAEAIDIYNESRDLMRELYELRKSEHPPLKGTSVFNIIQASQRIPKKSFNKELKKFIVEIKKKAPGTRDVKGPRIMIAGSLLHNSRLIEIVEEAGALVVCDDLCFGSRYFSGNIEKTNDLIKAISTRYLLKTPCARMKRTELRLEKAKKLAEEYKVDGIIYQTLKFCDNHLYDYPLYRDFFQKIGVPVLQIENDFLGGNLGQVRTRIEAFIEML